jgi:hypothetical protein
MMHFMDEIDVILENKIARFIRDKQDMTHGGWPLYYGGAFDISCTIKSYYALKLVGDSTDAPHMVTCTGQLLLERGGAAKANVFTRIVAGHVRSDSVARRAGGAVGTGVVAKLVSFSASAKFRTGHVP